LRVSPKEYDRLDRCAKSLGIALSKEQLEQLGEFLRLLTSVNEHTNLVANAQAESLLKDHVADSLSLMPIIQELEGLNGNLSENAALIDIGSGGGFPGLVLAIARPSIKVVLVDSVAKKARFLSEAITKLSLSHRIKVLNSRAEDLAHEDRWRHQFNYVTSRAVGPLAMVLELTLPFLRPGGLALLQKSYSQCQQEAKLASQAVLKLKGQLSSIFYPNEALLGKKRAILVFELTSHVPKQYPRSWVKLKKEPLF